MSEHNIDSELFFNLKFLDKYVYQDGNFYYNDYGAFVTNQLDRSFVWLSYDYYVYEQAKEEYIFSYLPKEAENNVVDACGFTFMILDKYYESGFAVFPRWFTAFGYNDEEQTLVFIGFCCTREDESRYVSLAETDFGAFLKHFYGDWYEWE